MKRLGVFCMVYALMSMSLVAHEMEMELPTFDFVVANQDGVNIYYRFVDENHSYCEVAYGQYSYPENGVLKIPDYVQVPTEPGDIVIDDPIPVVGVGYCAFYMDDNIQEVYLPETCLYLESGAFYGCESLKTMHVDDNLISIGECCFYCDYLLEPFAIPESLEYTGYYAFYRCETIQEPLYNSHTFFYYPMLRYADKGQSYTIPEGIQNINYAAFTFTELDEVNIPNTVKVIGDYAFDGSDISHVTIPNSVTTIGRKAFSQTLNLSEVTIPSSVTSIGKEAFYHNALHKVIWESPVDCIPENCFSIGRLELFEMPSWIRKIEAYAFSQNNELTDIDLSHIDSLGVKAFYFCDHLKSITLGGNLKTIPSFCFYLCDGLESIFIPETVDSIGNLAFEQCSSLKKVTLPNSLRTIGYRAFSSCDGMMELDLGHGVQTIDWSAFSNCDNLRSIDIPSCVEQIGDNAFGVYSENLTDVTVHWEHPLAVQFDLFASYYKSRYITLHVPQGCLLDYAGANCWSDFKQIIDDAAEETGIELMRVSPAGSAKTLVNGKMIIGKYGLDGTLDYRFLIR